MKPIEHYIAWYDPQPPEIKEYLSLQAGVAVPWLFGGAVEAFEVPDIGPEPPKHAKAKSFYQVGLALALVGLTDFVFHGYATSEG